MSYFFTLVNTTTCGSAQRHARAEFIQGCKDDEQFRDQYVLPTLIRIRFHSVANLYIDELTLC
jgi:hypothetical protein